MHHRFRVTYVRTAYCEIDVDAENCRAAEGLFEEMAAALPGELEQGSALTRPRYCIVDIAPLTETSEKRDEALHPVARTEPCTRILVPALPARRN